MISAKINNSPFREIPVLSPDETAVPIFTIAKGKKIRNLYIRNDSESDLFVYVEMPNREKRVGLPLTKVDMAPFEKGFELDIDSLPDNNFEYRYIFTFDLETIYIVEGYVLFTIFEGVQTHLFYVYFPHILILADNYKIMLNDVDEYQGNYYLGNSDVVFQYFQMNNMNLIRDTFIAGSRKNYYVIELYNQMVSYLRGSGILHIYPYSNALTAYKGRPLELLFIKYIQVLLEITIRGLTIDLSEEKEKLIYSYNQNAKSKQGNLSDYYKNINHDIKMADAQLTMLNRNAAILIQLNHSSILNNIEYREDTLSHIGPLLPGNPYLYSMYHTIVLLLSLNKPTSLLSANKISIYGANEIYESWCYFKVLEALEFAGYSYNRADINVLKYSGNIQKLSEIALWNEKNRTKIKLFYDKYYNLLEDKKTNTTYGYPGGRYRREHDIDQHGLAKKRNPDIAVEVFSDLYFQGDIPIIIFFDATYSNNPDTIEGKLKYKDRVFFRNSSGVEESCGYGAWALHPATQLSPDASPREYIDEIRNSGALALTPGHPNSSAMLNELISNLLSEISELLNKKAIG